MAFRRQWLAGLGIDEEKIAAIMAEHVEVTEALKKERDGYREKADQLEDVQKELEGLKKADYKKKYEDEHTAFESYKSSKAAEENAAALDKAARSYLEGKNIRGKNLDIAVRALAKEISALELDGGKIKDTAALDEQIGGDLAGLVSKKKGEHTEDPPGGGGGGSMTKEEIEAIEDRDERTAAIAKNLDLFVGKE